ncbi:hypothetical protein DUI87_18286 [Hirundo rustica rustica]|uniref:Uncharacterized protein n=1 Tax=Hirundo rustica rustica TaxID=333673 RepID=A0A3M0K1H2_HIRRU|nr:hypothetical protein DUI87_18286 [Hirundo rustica rustica]
MDKQMEFRERFKMEATFQCDAENPYVHLNKSSIDDWTETQWREINVEQMDEQLRRFAKGCYDWGTHAIKSALVIAGSLKQGEKNRPEDWYPDRRVKNNKVDLASLYIKIGAKNMPTVFLLTDAQVPDECFLVLINDLKASERGKEPSSVSVLKLLNLILKEHKKRTGCSSSEIHVLSFRGLTKVEDLKSEFATQEAELQLKNQDTEALVAKTGFQTEKLSQEKAIAAAEELKREKEKEKEKEKETGPNEVQLPKHPGEDEAAAKPQTKETVSEADTAQASAKPEFSPTEWTDIKKCSMSAKGMNMPVNYGTQNVNPRWESLDREVVRDQMNLLKGDCFVTSLPFFLAVLGEKMPLYGLIFQWDSSQKDPLLILEWNFLSYRFPKMILTSQEMIAQIIIKARTRLQTMAGKDFTTIYLPLKKEYFDWALRKSEDLQIALLDYPGVCTIHFPSHKLLKAKLSFREKPKISEVPLDAITVFTDGSGKTHKSAPFPMMEALGPIATLTDDATALAWSNEGDRMSTENATVLTNYVPRLKTKKVNSTRIFISSFTLNWLTLTYKPELQAQTTFINFTVTRVRLEDQLFAEVVYAERQNSKNVSAKPAPTIEEQIIPQGILGNSIKITGEPPTRMLANFHAALYGFDRVKCKFCLVRGKKEEKEDMRMWRAGAPRVVCSLLPSRSLVIPVCYPRNL